METKDTKQVILDQLAEMDGEGSFTMEGIQAQYPPDRAPETIAEAYQHAANSARKMYRQRLMRIMRTLDPSWSDGDNKNR